MCYPGYQHTSEAKRKIAEASKGRVLSDETRRKISEASKGRVLSEEARRKLSEAKKGKVNGPPSEETRRKISEAHVGVPLSKEHCRRISEAHKGKKLSEEHRRKSGEGQKGHPVSDETRRKIADGNRGKIRSEEVRRKLSEARKGKYCGPEHPNWKGGVAYGPYCPKFNREFKERVRNFFGRICVECGAPETGRGLCVHHVNFRKDACCAEDAIPLFVPLCPSCHSKTNFNREYWDARYTALINERYGGQCYLPKRADRPVGEALATTEDIAERLMVLVGEKVLP